MDYYKITTTCTTNGVTKLECVGSAYGLNRRPAGSVVNKSGYSIYTDWMTADEIKENYPTWAKQHGF